MLDLREVKVEEYLDKDGDLRFELNDFNIGTYYLTTEECAKLRDLLNEILQEEIQ